MKRREIIQGAAALPLVIANDLLGARAPSETLNLAGVGVGGMGANYL